ncbi:MAG: signal peptidase I [Candidatus Nanopelagicus sp.]|jgi:signal peptidase
MLIREIFSGQTDSQLWLEGSPLKIDENILITLTSAAGEQSAYISSQGVTVINAGQLVEAAPEVENEDSKKQHLGIKKAMSVSGYLVAILLIVFAGFSFTGNVKARIVLTGSMSPAISVGDVIVTVPITQKEPQIDDVIAYQAKRFNGENVAVFSHRIIDGDIENGFIVKGDANKSPDPQKPKAGDILGVVLFTIPFIGNLLTPKALFLLIPCLFGLWLIMDAMKNVE